MFILCSQLGRIVFIERSEHNRGSSDIMYDKKRLNFYMRKTDLEETYNLVKQLCYESTASLETISRTLDKTANAFQTLELITELDRKKNDPEEYKKAIIGILWARGWID